MPASRPYHHGDLRRTLLSAAAVAVADAGPAALSLRDLARRAGVSHAAPAHHFGDKAGLLTALAAEGYDLLADALTAAREETDSLLEIGVAYVRFAVAHRAHFEVMFQPELYRPDDPALVAARSRAGEALRARVAGHLDGADDPDEGGRSDGSGRGDDAAQPDAARPDAVSPDAARPDAVSPDAARPDAAPSDAARSDAARSDAARSDAGGAGAAMTARREAGLAAWSIVHGFAALWLGGVLPPEIGTDPEAAARTVIRLLFR